MAFSLFTGIRNAALLVIAMAVQRRALRSGTCLRHPQRFGTRALRRGVFKIGLLPGTGGCWLLPRMVGLSKAAAMIFTGDHLGAEVAPRLGLLSRLVPHGNCRHAR